MDVDPDLVRAVQRGEPGAMEALIRATHVDVHRLALRILRDQADAADATQEVFLRVMRSVNGFRFEARFGTWLHRVTVNVCATMLRRRGDQRARGQAAGAVAFEEGSFGDGDGGGGMGGHVPAVEEVVLDLQADGPVAEAVRGLSDDDRAIVVLRDLEGLSTKEAADVLGISEGAAKVRLHRAHARLREAIRAGVGSSAGSSGGPAGGAP